METYDPFHVYISNNTNCRVCLTWWTMILLLQINYIFSHLCKWTTHGDYSYGFVITNKDSICYIPWFFYMCIIVWFCTELEATKLQSFAYSTPPMFSCNKIYMKIHYLFWLSKKKKKNQCYTLLNHERLQEHKIFQLSQPVKFFLQQGVTSAELRSTGYGVYNPNPLLLSFDPFFTISSIVLAHLTLDECSLV